MNHREPNGMTVNELIEALEEMRAMGMGDQTIMFSYGSGDYWGTTIARSPEHVDVERVRWTDYHRTWEVPNEDEERFNYEFDSENDPEVEPFDDSGRFEVVVMS